ncbi:hypothetical protein ABEB36_002641 [Hypothenemus hampei]|uniref:Uncharacterized protein n=1 Tax=Hypothenemus hampei TaxID=57062 RepID=A0ABD1F6H1_HYPHA
MLSKRIFDRKMTNYKLIVLALVAFAEAMPTDLQAIETNEISYNPFSSSFKWTKYNIAILSSAVLVVAAGAAILTAMLFPMFIYKICYALGGCQNTLDNYVDRFLGSDGLSKRSIKRRDVREINDMEYILNFLKIAMEEYGNQTGQRQQRENSSNKNVMTISKGDSHLIEKRSPIDYIESILVMMSKAYNEYVDPDLKKNFKKLPFIR